MNIEDWIECSLGDLLKLKNGYAFKSSKYQNEGVPVLRIGDIQDWNVDIKNAKRIEEDEEYDSHIVNKGDILIAMSGATTGKFGIYNSEEKAYQNQRVGNLIPHSKKYTLKNYIYYLLYSLKRDIEQQAYGGAQPNISATKIEALSTKLFPLPIQKAIVKKIEALFTHLDSGIADLKKAQDQLVIYRQAVLKKAFERELMKNAEKYKLKNITSKIGSGSTPKGGQANYKTSGIPLIRSLNIHFDHIKYDGLAFIDESQAEKLKNVIVQQGDVLLNITGASIGRVNIAPNEFDNGRVNQHVSIIRPKDKIFNTKFLKLYIQSSKIQSWIANVNVGATRQGLTKSALENLEIPVPSLQEQHQIISDIESRLSVCDTVEKDIANSLEKAQALRQSILKKAFDGKLLNEEEIAACKAHRDYEPASVSLERIRAEKTK
jgi:type I restriction enzyme S subunit|tara:strand:+ start:55333 stop:56631 length:1299 start_codon:yes stop_codon:yes gene_type:complete